MHFRNVQKEHTTTFEGRLDALSGPNVGQRWRVAKEKDGQKREEKEKRRRKESSLRSKTAAKCAKKERVQSCPVVSVFVCWN